MINNQWQDISTARNELRDSQSRLIWVPENKCTYCVFWREAHDDTEKSGWVIFGGDRFSRLQRATHWRPMPAPPKEIK